MNFGEAWTAALAGSLISRKPWPNLHVGVVGSDLTGTFTTPSGFMTYPIDNRTSPGAVVPWVPNPFDLFADDWFIV